MDISPDRQNIDAVFSNTNYYIDFYQREYKWAKAQVNLLLEDIFYKFNVEYNVDLDAKEENIHTHYSWYYLNTYITDKSDGKTYIVDGQQRLTTLTLILIKLYHLCAEGKLNSKHQKWVQGKILGYSSAGEEFWMGHDKRKKTLCFLLAKDCDKETPETNDISEKNMIENYSAIASYLDKNLGTTHKLDTFIFYFLKRLVLVNLDVKQTDVPMVFEVINDRGERLKPYEILKGKLLGQIHKDEVDEYNTIWEEKIKELQILDSDLVDDFFRTYLQAKFSSTRAEARKFDGDYHKIIFDNDVNRELQLKHNATAVKNFIKNQFSYYVELYKKLILNYSTEYHDNQPFVYFNSLNKQEQQIMLIIASCEVKDAEEEIKIHLISKLFDKAFVLLQLNKSYDSNQFSDAAYGLNKLLRGAALEDFECVFNDMIISKINVSRNASVESPFQYNYFKEIGYQDLNQTFLRYYFSRIEQLLARALKLGMKNTFDNYVRNTGARNGYHIEHILGRNEENLKVFNTDDEFFEKERNRIGGLLLMKGRDNQSSSNEVYADKLKSYVNTNYWNETLLVDFYKSNNDLKDFISLTGLDFRPIEIFNAASLEERTALLFEITKAIWSDQSNYSENEVTTTQMGTPTSNMQKKVELSRSSAASILEVAEKKSKSSNGDVLILSQTHKSFNPKTGELITVCRFEGGRETDVSITISRQEIQQFLSCKSVEAASKVALEIYKRIGRVKGSNSRPRYLVQNILAKGFNCPELRHNLYKKNNNNATE